MILLAIDTASDQLGVAVVDEHRVLASYELLAERPHAVELPQAVTRVLQAAEQTLERIDGIAVDLGPGSFTGLRIGLAFMKGLVFQCRKPVVGVASLDVVAAGMPYLPHPVCVLLDAKQRNVYTALYDTTAGRAVKQSDYALRKIDDLIPALTGPVYFVGDGLALYRERLLERLGPHAWFAPPECWTPQAATLGRLGLERLRTGSTDDPRTLVPLYLYPKDSSVNPTMRVASQTPEVRLTTS